MQSLDVYKYINSLARSRSDDLTHGREETANFNRTFKGDRINIHVFTSHGDCVQILKDASFIQPRVADAITEISRSLGVGLKPIENFLRQNPIEMNGAMHAAVRPSFIRDYGATQRRLAGDLPAICRKAFDDFIVGNKSGIVADLVEPYVDAVVEAIFKGKSNSGAIGRESWAGNSSCIFEYVHSATKLRKKSDQTDRLCRQFGLRIDGEGSDESRSTAILLTYVLQGRDPLIGAMSAFMHSLIAMNEDERGASVQTTTARDLFWRTAPVNYIGRIATKAVPVRSIPIEPGDQIVLMLSWANHDRNALAKNSLAFGAGAHVCAGQALALAIGEAWLIELRNRHANVGWDEIKPDRPTTTVFRQYRTQ
jgi:cytochrome P450